MFFLPHQSGELLASALGKAHSPAIPTADQMSHKLGGWRGRPLIAMIAQIFQRLAHNF
ncbi:MAG: hypothetical protein ACREP6_01445 [Candidatus Binataceae bacterium]